MTKPYRKVKDKYCKGCIYQGWAAQHSCCDYIFIKDECRPCPPGKDCTVKQKKMKGKKVVDNV